MLVSASGHNDREIGIGVGIPTPDSTTKKDRSRIEKSPFTILNRLETTKEFSILFDLVGL